MKALLLALGLVPFLACIAPEAAYDGPVFATVEIQLES